MIVLFLMSNSFNEDILLTEMCYWFTNISKYSTFIYFNFVLLIDEEYVIIKKT